MKTTAVKKEKSTKLFSTNLTVKVDKNLDNLKDVKFKSNKLEEIKKLNFKLNFDLQPS